MNNDINDIKYIIEMTEFNCCTSLYRTCQVAKSIIIFPPLFAFGVCALGSNAIGSVFGAPIEYIVTGDINYKMGEKKSRTIYILST